MNPLCGRETAQQGEPVLRGLIQRLPKRPERPQPKCGNEDMDCEHGNGQPGRPGSDRMAAEDEAAERDQARRKRQERESAAGSPQRQDKQQESPSRDGKAESEAGLLPHPPEAGAQEPVEIGQPCALQRRPLDADSQYRRHKAEQG